MLWSTGDAAGALARTLEGIEVAAQLGLGSGYGTFLRLNAVYFAHHTGDWGLAERLLREANVRVSSEDGSQRYVCCYSLPFLVARGAADAEETWDRGRRLVMAQRSITTSEPPIHAAGADLELWRGRPERALAIAREGLEALALTDAVLHVLGVARVAALAAADVAVASTDARQRQEALAAIEHSAETAHDALARVDDAGGSLRAIASAELATIDAARARALEGDAVSAWRAAVARWLALGWPYHAACAQGRLGIAAEMAGDRSAAIAALRDANTVAVSLGAMPLKATLERAARRLRVELAARGPAHAAGTPERPYGLSARELEVLRLVAAGRTNRQIAADLFIAENTAGVHVSNILGKMGVATRTEAATVALRDRLVDS